MRKLAQRLTKTARNRPNQKLETRMEGRKRWRRRATGGDDKGEQFR